MADIKITQINTDTAPRAIGPYSQAVKANGFIFVSGQIALDPDSDSFTEKTIAGQTQQALDNLKNILLSNGTSLEKVVKVEIFIKDIRHFSIINEIYSTYFTSDVKPARQVIEVSELPKNSMIEISCIAVE